MANLISGHFPKNKIFDAHAQYIYIVYAKYQ